MIERMAVHWKTIGYGLSFEIPRIRIIEESHRNVENACVAMLEYWLDTDKTATWHQLLEAMEHTDILPLLARDLKHALTQ